MKKSNREMIEQERYIADLKSKFESYSSISNESWLLIKENIQFQTPEKGGNPAKGMADFTKGLFYLRRSLESFLF